ncbi:MAG: PAS domain-containing protein [Hyphomicrobiaceae bacterium]
MAESEFSLLLKTYKFLDSAIAAHSTAMTTDDLLRLRTERAQVFRLLLSLPSDTSKIAILQLRALLEALPKAASDPELIDFIAETSMRHLELLSSALERASGPPGRLPLVSAGTSWPDDDRFAQFDASPDRIVIIDRDYRYRFANRQNAEFHGIRPNEFIDVPLWARTCEHFFERVTKPVFDRCFAGHATSCVAPHPRRRTDELYSAHLDPIVGANGQVIAALAIVRRLDVLDSSA